MSWEDFVSHILATSSKVDKMAVLDTQGRPIAISAETEISQSEGQAVIKCLTDPAKTMTKLSIDDDVFLCIQGIEETFIGTSIRNRSKIVVAHKEGDHVIIVFGQSLGRGSFIHEIKQSLTLRAQGQLIGQQELQQHQDMLPIDPVPGLTPKSPVESEQVLIDLVSETDS